MRAAALEGRYQHVLLELAALDKSDTQRALRRILRLDAETLDIERVNLWRLETDPFAIRCEQAYEQRRRTYESGRVLFTSDFPRYFRALKEEQLIAADDAHTDPRTSELTRDYFVPLGIGATLDIPIWVQGRLAGVLCHEHVGSSRRWTAGQCEFATSMGQIVATTLEVRERRRAEKALRQEEQKSSQLAESAQNARAQVRAREELLSIASHELCTPLASLQLAVDAMRTGRLSAADVERSLSLADRQVKRLTQLVSNLLDLSRIQSGKIQLARDVVDLDRLTRDVTERFADVLKQANCILEIRSCGQVVGSWDRSRLDQVITNLLSNAAKFGKGAPVEVTVARDSANARLVVRDHGIGIPPEKLPFVFERFERADSTRSFEGLGLGLFIVRAIVETHGGTVRAENVDGRGTAMTVELPLGPQPTGADGPKPAETRH